MRPAREGRENAQRLKDKALADLASMRPAREGRENGGTSSATAAGALMLQ